MVPILQVKSLRYKVGGKTIIDDLSFSVEEGRFVAFIGPSSSGKTTLLKLIAGILPSNDSILVGYGYLNAKKGSSDLSKFGCVFSDEIPFLFESVYQELLFPLENLCYTKSDMEMQIKDLVSFFEVSSFLDKKQEDLTQEEKAILRLLLALVHHPSILVLDDPFLMIGRKRKKQVIAKLKQYCQENKMTLLLSSSNLEDILFCDYTYVLNDGAIVMEGSTKSILEEDVNLKKLGLELPFMVDLSHMLSFYEILDGVYLEMEDMVEKLWK